MPGLRPPLKLPNAQQALVRRVEEVAVASIRDVANARSRRAFIAEVVGSRRALPVERQGCGQHQRPCRGDLRLSRSWPLSRPIKPGVRMEAKGVTALLDPQFAARLRLSVSQRRELEELLWEKLDFQGELSKLGQAGLVLQQMPEGEARKQLTQQALAERNTEMDAAIWSVLRPNQVRELERILGQRAPQGTPAKAKKPRRAS